MLINTCSVSIYLQNLIRLVSIYVCYDYNYRYHMPSVVQWCTYLLALVFGVSNTQYGDVFDIIHTLVFIYYYNMILLNYKTRM